MLCPMPVIRLGEKARQLAPGETIELVATDPGVNADIPAWCRVHGHRVLEKRETPDTITFIVEIGE